MGTFLYTLDERAKLQQAIQQPVPPRSDGYTRFEASSMEHLSADQISHLDRVGVRCSDIRMVSYYNGRPVENTFTKVGNKELDTIVVPFNSRGFDPLRMSYGFYNLRLAQGSRLIPKEEDEYQALKLYFEATDAQEADDSSRVNSEVRYYFLNAKIANDQATDVEKEEHMKLLEVRVKKMTDTLFSEIDQAGLSMVELVKDRNLFGALLGTLHFDEELLLPYEFPVWWDYERFLHVYIRHVKELQAGKYVGDKTNFQYKAEDVQRVVKSVLEQIYPEIAQHFKDNPDKRFFRIVNRAVYFNGNYYRVDIEPNGRLVAFHPYNENAADILDET